MRPIPECLKKGVFSPTETPFGVPTVGCYWGVSNYGVERKKRPLNVVCEDLLATVKV